MEAQIRASRERTAEAVARAHAEGDASTSDMVGSDDFSGAESTDSDEVIKEAEWYGLNMEKLGPVDPLDAMEVPDVPDRESLKAFLEAKADEKKAIAEEKKAKAEEKEDEKPAEESAKPLPAKEDEKPAEESAEPLSEKAKVRRAGMSAFGTRMLDCTLDQVIEEIPGEMTGIEEVENKASPTSPAEGAGEHTSVVEESTVGPSGEVTMPIAAVTESSAVPVPEATPQVPEEQDRHLCQACQGSGQCSEDMNRAVMIILEAQAKALAEASLVSAVKDEKEGGESPAPDDDKRQGDFTVNLGMTSVDLIVIELCCGRSSELSQATKRLNATYVGVHDHLESPSLRQQVLRALMTAGTGRKRCLIYCHVSLPCTGGSPLLNFSKPGVREHHQVKFLNLLSSLGGYLSGIKRLDPKALIILLNYLIRISIGDLIW